LVESHVRSETPEDDLFAGLRGTLGEDGEEA